MILDVAEALLSGRVDEFALAQYQYLGADRPRDVRDVDKPTTTAVVSGVLALNGPRGRGR